MTGVPGKRPYTDIGTEIPYEKGGENYSGVVLSQGIQKIASNYQENWERGMEQTLP